MEDLGLTTDSTSNDTKTVYSPDVSSKFHKANRASRHDLLAFKGDFLCNTSGDSDSAVSIYGDGLRSE